jgi:DNA invertase Pin-like site-specific DNA recombinase
LQEQLLAEVRRLGAELFSTSAAEGAYLLDDPDDPSRKLIRQILGAVSEYKRGMIGLRLRSGRRRKAERGGYAFGAPPFGYAAHDGQLVEEPHEQATLVHMGALRDEGASLRAIAQDLEAADVRPRRGTRWHPAVLARILEREAASATT